MKKQLIMVSALALSIVVAPAVLAETLHGEMQSAHHKRYCYVKLPNGGHQSMPCSWESVHCTGEHEQGFPKCTANLTKAPNTGYVSEKQALRRVNDKSANGRTNPNTSGSNDRHPSAKPATSVHKAIQPKGH